MVINNSNIKNPILNNEKKNKKQFFIFYLLLFIFSLTLLFINIFYNNSFLLTILYSMFIIFSIIEGSKQLILLKKLNVMINTFEQERYNFFIYLNWNKSKIFIPYMGSFLFLNSLIIFLFYIIFLFLDNEFVSPKNNLALSLSVFVTTFILIFLVTIISYQKFESLINAYSYLGLNEDKKLELYLLNKKTSASYRKTFIYFYLCVTIIFLPLFLFPKNRNRIKKIFKF